MIDIADSVRTIRALKADPMLGYEDEEPLSRMTWHRAETFGEALDAFLDDFRTGFFAQFRSVPEPGEPRSRESNKCHAGIEFTNAGERVCIRVVTDCAAAYRFYGRSADPFAATLTIKREVESYIMKGLPITFWERLAVALGPLVTGMKIGGVAKQAP